MVGIIDDHLVVDQFVEAVNALCHKAHAIAVDEATREGLLTWLHGRPIRAMASDSVRL